MRLATGFLPFLVCSGLLVHNRAVSGQPTTPDPNASCPSLGTLRYEAAKYVAEFFQGQADGMQAYIQHAIQNKRNAKRALAACYGEIESAKSLKAARVSQAAQMAKDVQRLEGEKAAAEAARDRALQEFNDAKPPHVASAADAARARQEADAALKRANERSREAAEAWAEANAAQQSTKWVPATNVKPNAPGNHNGHHQQTATTYGTSATAIGTQKVPSVQTKVAPDATKLTERAKAAEFAAAVAKSEADRLSEVAKAAETASRSVWNSMSPNVRSYHEADAQYNAICLAFSHKKASYDAAVLSINDATNLIFTKQADIRDAKARIKHAEARIAEYKAQLSTILVVANYAAGLAQAIKDETYASTTASPASTATTAGPTGTTAQPTTTRRPRPGNAAPFDEQNLEPAMIEALRQLQERVRARTGRQPQSLPATGTRQATATANTRARTANRTPAVSPAFMAAIRASRMGSRVPAQAGSRS